MQRGYDVGHDDLDLSIRTAEAFLPSTHRVIAKSELVRLTAIAHAAGEAAAAKRFWPDIRRTFANGRAQGVDMTLRALRYRWLFVAAIAVVFLLAGRASAGVI